MKATDLTGRQFGRLTAVEPVRQIEGGRSRIYWRCRCLCGRPALVECSVLAGGRQASCGCLRDEVTAKKNLSHGCTINRTPTVEYQAWHRAKQRCYNANDRKYPIYGGRGIRMAGEWMHDFAAFFAHVGPRTSSKHSLDRKDVNGDYAPGNVRWATARQQAENRRDNVLVDSSGEKVTLRELARRFDVNYQSLHNRVKVHGENARTAAKRLARRRHRV